MCELCKDDIDRQFHCVDCDTWTMSRGGVGEYYMVTHELWAEYGCGGGMLCVGCLEKRMGRELRADDFLSCPLNDVVLFPDKSERLKERLSCLEMR